MVKVKIEQGTLIGSQRTTANGKNYFGFLEIPYAQPPVGDLRFKSPRPPKPWEGERDATTNHPNHIAQQFEYVTFNLIGSEDCLYLNVSTPKLPENETDNHLPILVYIHGGGFISGNGVNQDFNIPDNLIDHDVVLVTINYRLNVFGFLSLDLPEAAGNMGLKDQVLALKWVKKNISAFGGDPNNVTIYGLSAGAASVEYLLLSETCKGLFSKAILQSGSAINHWASQYNILDLSVKLAQNLGFEGNETDAKAIHEFLMQQTSENISIKAKETVDEFPVNGLNFGFVPTIEKDFDNDEAFLTIHPYNVLDSGNFIRVPTIRGFCQMEGLLNDIFNPNALKKLKEDKIFTDFWKYPLNSNDREYYNKKLYEEYLGGKNDDTEIENSIFEFLGHHDFTAGIILATQKALFYDAIPAYLYMFAYDSPESFVKKLFKSIRKGVCHGSDSGCTLGIDITKFNGKIMAPSETDVLISNRMCKMWTDFAKTGNPTPSTDELIPIVWPAYNAEEQPFLVIDEEMRIQHKYEPSKIAIFEEIYNKYRK